ncbi:MAG TPA: histidine kinase [Streptosporangiaceae bacterium]|nr:histidine kinase [Streptosporangiaceae bacterium]
MVDEVLQRLRSTSWPGAWIRRYPYIGDAALAVAVLALSGPPVSAISGHRHGLSLALVIAFVCPLIWRRRAPFPVFLVMTGLALAQLVVNNEELNVDIGLIVAFYTVAAYEPLKRILLAAALLEAGAIFFAAAFRTLGLWALLSTLVLVAGLLGYYARTRRAYLATLVERAERLEHERDQQAQLAAAAERTRIAREVHDIVAHNIAVMIALAEGAAYTASTSTGQAVSLMGQVSETGRSALTDMRRLLGVLREPDQLERTPQPTLDDIEDLLATIRAAGLPVRLTVTGQPFPLPAAAQLALYRLIQEALTNTLKHAPGAAGAQVRVAYLPGEVGLEITDTGRPGTVAPPSTDRSAGHGIAGMRERAAVFGGQVTAGPRSGGGWRIHTVLRLGGEP